MISTELSEKRRLYPVIGIILKLSSQELAEIDSTLRVEEEQGNELNATLDSIGAFANSAVESFWSLWG